MTFKKQILSIILAFLIVMSMWPLSASAYSGYDYASGALGDRLNSIINNGVSGCVSPSLPAVGKSLNNSQWYTTSYANQSGSSEDKQCQAYARAAYSYLFGYNLATGAYRREITSAKGMNSFSYTFFKNNDIRCGAYLRTTPSSSGKYNGNDGHSILILSYNSSGVTTLEGNADGKGKISIINYSWKDFNYSAFGRRSRYVCSLSQPTDAIYASLGSTIPPTPPHTTHTKGAFQFCEALHPHYNYWRCSVCGQNFTDGSTSYVDSCPQCNPGLSVVSRKEGNWKITIPANYNLLLYENPDSTSNLTNRKPDSESYFIRAMYEAKLSDGNIRYGGMWNHKGTNMILWFTLTSSMSVEDNSHTTHSKGSFRYTAKEHPHYNYYSCSECGEEFTDGSTTPINTCKQCHWEHVWDGGKTTQEPTVSQPGTRTYTCTICGETKTETIPALAVASGTCGANLTWTLDRAGTLTISGSGKMTDYTYSAPWWNNKGSIKKVVIGNSVTSIGDYAFINCSSLTSVTIPDSVTSIGSDAFFNCSSLTNVTIGNSVTSIETRAFYYCTSLTNVTIGSSVTNIGDYAFWGCNSLTSVTIPNKVTSIGEKTFWDCSSLTSVTISDSVTSIGNDAFYNTRLTDVYYAGTKTQWEAIAVGYGNKSLNNARIHYTKEDTPTPTPGPTDKPEQPADTFNDVPSTAYYSDAVKWAVQKKITSGIGEGKFGPNNSCTRGQIVTFLWRSAGSPEPQNGSSSFVDIEPGDYYYKAVLWAVGNNITSGTDATHFSPNAKCTRAQAMTFIWRAEGKPKAVSKSPFSDVSPESYYADAVDWGVQNGITSGTGNNKFGSDDTCSRGQIVTFMYRGMK